MNRIIQFFRRSRNYADLGSEDFTVTRLATAKSGSFPFAAAQMYWHAGNRRHKGGECCPELADNIVVLRSRPLDRRGGKVRFDCCSVPLANLEEWQYLPLFE